MLSERAAAKRTRRMNTRLIALLLLGACAGCVSSPPDPGVRVTQPDIERRVVCRTDGLWINAVTPIAGKSGTRIVVGAHNGVAILDSSYSQTALVRFPGLDLDETRPVDLEGDGVTAYFDARPRPRATLISGEGKVLWSFPAEESPDYQRHAMSMCPVDLEGDGRPEFVVGCGGGIHAIDRAGKVLWSKDGGNVFSVEAVHTAGSTLIVHQNGMQDVVRATDGTEVRRFRVDGVHGRLFSWPGTLGEGEVLKLDQDSFAVVDLSGRVKESHDLNPDIGYLVSVLPVRLGGQTCYAATTNIAYQHGAGVFYLFDPSGKVLYEEVFSQRVGGIAVLPDTQDPGRDRILVGVLGDLIEIRQR